MHNQHTPGPPPADPQNPYQAPQVLTPSVAHAPPADVRLVKMLRDFRSQIIAIGALWIFLGVAAFALVAFLAGYLSDQRDVADPILLGVIGAVGLTWIALGVVVCLKQTWALYVALVLSYISLLGNLLQLQLCAVVLLIVVIMQAHRVLGWARELQAAGIPLTMRPEDLQVRLTLPG